MSTVTVPVLPCTSESCCCCQVVFTTVYETVCLSILPSFIISVRFSFSLSLSHSFSLSCLFPSICVYIELQHTCKGPTHLKVLREENRRADK